MLEVLPAVRLGETIQMIIRFEHWEIVRAANVGLERWLNAERDGRNNAIVNDPLKWGIDHHVLGAIGEYSVAKARGIEWIPETEGPDTYTGDVQRFQVKSTEGENNCLIVRENQPSEFIYVLVIVKRTPKAPYSARIAGWLLGSIAKQIGVKNFKNGKTSYFVSQDKLNDPKTLPK